MTRTTTGLVVGLVLGLAIAIDGVSGFLWTVVAGGIGFTVGRVLDGELDLNELLRGGGRPRP